MHISASILACDILNIEREIKEISAADSIHFDVMDGRYVNKISFGADLCNSVKTITQQPIHVHLMVENPDSKIDDFIAAGATAIIVHPEACNDLFEMNNKLKNAKVQFGFAIDSSTDFEAALQHQYMADLFIFMTVKIGESFQKIDLQRVKRMAEFSKKLIIHKPIYADGGINFSNINLCLNNGATDIISGGFIFKTEPHNQAIKELQNHAT